MQLAEAEQEAQAEHQRSQAAEQALEAQRRAAEYARSCPTSPFRDPGLQSELTNLRQQVRWTSSTPHSLALTPFIWFMVLHVSPPLPPPPLPPRPLPLPTSNIDDWHSWHCFSCFITWGQFGHLGTAYQMGVQSPALYQHHTI